MSSDERCAEVQERLTEALLARSEPDAADATHAAACARCGRTLLELRTLFEVLEAQHASEGAFRAVFEVPPCDAALRAARAELVGPPRLPALRPAPALAPGFGRELGRLLAFAVIPVPLLALWYAALLRLGGAFLAEWLPGFLVAPIGVAFGVGAASWLGLVYASIPVVAHRRVSRRSEVTA